MPWSQLLPPPLVAIAGPSWARPRAGGRAMVRAAHKSAQAQQSPRLGQSVRSGRMTLTSGLEGAQLHLLLVVVVGCSQVEHQGGGRGAAAGGTAPVLGGRVGGVAAPLLP